MKKSNHNLLRKPILACILIYFYTELVSILCTIFSPSNLFYIVLPVVSLLLLVIHRLWFRGEFKGFFNFDFLSDKKLMLLMGAFVLMDIAETVFDITQSGFAAPTLVGLTMSISAGISEEVASRALPISTMMRSYKDKGTYIVALILPALFFGASHFINLMAGQSFENTLLQVISAGAAGILFGAIYLRTGSIIPSMVIHFSHDFLCFLVFSTSTGISVGAPSLTDIIILAVYTIIQLVIAYLILRGQKEHIQEVWKEKWNVQK